MRAEFCVKSKHSIIALLLTLISWASGAAQQLLPASVTQFLHEREIRQRLAAATIDGDQDFFRYVPARVVDDQEYVDAFIGIDCDAIIPELVHSGVKVNSAFDGFITAQVPVDRLETICRLPGVNDVEISQRLKLCTDSTLRVTRAGQILKGVDYNLPASFDGSGVIVGVIDRGFDYQHRAFRRSDDPSKTRISRVYSTTVTTGHPARYGYWISLPGSVFMGDEIYSLTTDSPNNTHGTHTASIAAGTHVNGYGGMAPGAEIVLCAVSVLDGGMSATEVINCIRYIDSYADSVGKPCVMSLSVSTPNGQRDGLDYLSKAVKQIMGPGRLFVISAGNDGGRMAYAHRLASPSSPLHILFKYKGSGSVDSTYNYSGMLADVWMRTSSRNLYYRFHVLDQRTGNIVWESEQLASANRITTDDIGEFFTFDTARDTIGYLEGKTSTSYGKYRLEVTLRNLVNKEYTTVNGVKYGRYALGMSIYPRTQAPVEIDAWACNSGSALSVFNGRVTHVDGVVYDNFYAPPSDSCCIGTYAVGDSTISAGAFAARNSYFSMSQNRVVTDNSITVGDIANFSSYQAAGTGPTGKALPTICAPGIDVVAAGSRYSYFARGNSSTVMATDDGSYWGVMSGTSMAAPTVAGIIALWLQANPKLSVGEAMDILAQTAIRDDFTLGVHRSRFGPNGKIDAMAGMQMVLKRLGFRLGDVNGDGKIDVSDITMLISYVLGKEMSGFNSMAADVNSDGKIDVSDVVAVIQMILKG